MILCGPLAAWNVSSQSYGNTAARLPCGRPAAWRALRGATAKPGPPPSRCWPAGRKTRAAHDAVDLMKHDELVPGNYIRWRLGDQQRESTVGRVFMRCEERLDPARTSLADAVDVDPPTSAAGYSKREVGEGLNASLAQLSGCAWLNPVVDPVADPRCGNWRAAELLNGGGHGACGCGAFAGSRRSTSPASSICRVCSVSWICVESDYDHQSQHTRPAAPHRAA